MRIVKHMHVNIKEPLSHYEQCVCAIAELRESGTTQVYYGILDYN